MSRSQIRLQYTYQGEETTVADDQALLETKVIRHMNKLQELGSSTLKSWMMQAFKAQFLLENGNVKIERKTATAAEAEPVAKESSRPSAGGDFVQGGPLEEQTANSLRMM